MFRTPLLLRCSSRVLSCCVSCVPLKARSRCFCFHFDFCPVGVFVLFSFVHQLMQASCLFFFDFCLFALRVFPRFSSSFLCCACQRQRCCITSINAWFAPIVWFVLELPVESVSQFTNSIVFGPNTIILPISPMGDRMTDAS